MSDRKLAAIMFTDIVGYTSMMQRDERLAVKSVKKFEEVIRKIVPLRDGEIVQFYGDGSLSIFTSATNAVECAMSLQVEMLSGFEVPLRIGVHLGEILRDGERVFGDGVNLASRVESMGVKGAVLISNNIYQQIKNNTTFKTASLGHFNFKNVERPMEVFAISNDGFPVPDRDSLKGKFTSPQRSESGVFGRILNFFGNTRPSGPSSDTTHMPKESHHTNGGGSPEPITDSLIPIVSPTRDSAKTIVVLPFDNQSSIADQQYFVEGISNEIRSQLLSIKELKVISGSSCKSCKSKGLSLKEILNELKVSHVLEGSVQRLTDNVKVNVELSDTVTEQVIWASPPIHHRLDNMFELEHEIARSIIDELKLELSPEDQLHWDHAPTTNAEAYECYKLAKELAERSGGRIAELDEAISLYKKAIQIDPNYAQAYVGLSDTYLVNVFWGRRPVKDVISHALNAAFKALELDDKSGSCYGALGSINFYRMELRTSEKYLRNALDLSPNYIEAYVTLAWINAYHGRFDEAIEYIISARELDPLSTRFIGDQGHVYFFARQFQKGIDLMLTSLEKFPGDDWLLWVLGYLYCGSKEYEKAINMFKRRAAASNTNWMLGYAYGCSGQVEEATRILKYQLDKRKKQHVPAAMIATIYMGLGDKENTLKWWEIDYEDGGQGFFFSALKNDVKFDSIRDEARFKNLLSKVIGN